jgi:hypothetical protein
MKVNRTAVGAARHHELISALSSRATYLALDNCW